MSECSRESYLVFGGLDWWYQHRSHVDFQLIRRFAKRGPAMYVNSIVMMKPNLKEGRKLLKRIVRKTKSMLRGLRHSGEGFWVYSPFSMPVHHIPWAKPINDWVVRTQVRCVARCVGIRHPVLVVVCPGACDMALRMKRKALVYLRTDAYELFPNMDAAVILRYDRMLKETADLTLFVSRRLYEAEAGQCRQPLYWDHGVDYEMFASATNAQEPPDDLAAIKRPIVGFFGTIDAHTVDVELIAEVADRLPDLSFVLVGKTAQAYQCLVRRPNIHLLGQKEYAQVPRYGAGFDVAIMPWRQTPWIEACNPIKLKEYLALGKPIVSTPFAELKRYAEVVYVARTGGEFAEAIRTALAEDAEDRIAMRRDKVRESTWDRKAQQVLDVLGLAGGSETDERSRESQAASGGFFKGTDVPL